MEGIKERRNQQSGEGQNQTKTERVRGTKRQSADVTEGRNDGRRLGVTERETNRVMKDGASEEKTDRLTDGEKERLHGRG